MFPIVINNYLPEKFADYRTGGNYLVFRKGLYL